MDEKPKSKGVEDCGKVGANVSGTRTTKRKSQIKIMDDISRDSSEYPRPSKVPRYGDYEVVDLFTQEEEEKANSDCAVARGKECEEDSIPKRLSVVEKKLDRLIEKQRELSKLSMMQMEKTIEMSHLVVKNSTYTHSLMEHLDDHESKSEGISVQIEHTLRSINNSLDQIKRRLNMPPTEFVRTGRCWDSSSSELSEELAGKRKSE